jgi:hypothetical protein
VTEKVLKTLDAVTFRSATAASADNLSSQTTPVTVDVSARLRDMW